MFPSIPPLRVSGSNLDAIVTERFVSGVLSATLLFKVISNMQADDQRALVNEIIAKSLRLWMTTEWLIQVRFIH